MSSKRETKEREQVLQNRIIYSLPVRLGFWKDDVALEEEKKFIIAYKRDRGQLLIQKTRRMFDNLLRPCSLASSFQYVTYGESYQIKATDITRAFDQVDKFNSSLFLSGLVTEQEIDEYQSLTHGCLVTAANCKEPCVRNTFKIVGADWNKDGQQVLYGDDVLLKVSGNADEAPLFIQCENSTTECVGDHWTVRLSQIANIHCRFKFLYWNPQRRYETLGTNFSPNQRVIVQHTASGRNLAIEVNLCLPTFFGPECTVSCHTFRDCHKMETAENFWTIITSTKQPNT